MDANIEMFFLITIQSIFSSVLIIFMIKFKTRAYPWIQLSSASFSVTSPRVSSVEQKGAGHVSKITVDIKHGK